MARSLGAPARVAVGFTWGDPVEAEPNTYAVSGRQAHAWPEVYFPGAGWVAFEPTPGRGAPGATYTAVEPRQDSQTQPTLEETEAADAPDTPSTTIDPANLEPSLPDFDQQAQNTRTTGQSDSGVPRWMVLFWSVLAVMLAGAIGAAALTAGRLGTTGDPASTVDRDWAVACAWLRHRLNLARRESETRLEFAVRASKYRQVDDTALIDLAVLATESRYAESCSPASAEQARSLREEIVEPLKAARTVPQKVGDFLDPRWWWRLAAASRLIPRRLPAVWPGESRQKADESQLVP